MLASLRVAATKFIRDFSSIPPSSPRLTLAAVLSSALLAACGGGSGGSTSATSNGTTSATASATSSLSQPQVVSIQAGGQPNPRFAVAQDDLEVIGPFPSWANVKRDYGAVGDGVTDDTAALQRALDELGQPGKASVLYLPAGTYKISSSLRLSWNAQIAGYGWGGIGIIGDSPSVTRITWAGPRGGAMLIQDGGYNTRYARITWDGKGSAGYGIAHWWNALAGTRYDGSSEDVDEVFQDMGIGIMAGRLGAAYGQMNSEGVVRRVTFLRNSYAGLDTGSFNALDWWVFDSHFVDCARGVTNTFSIDDNGVTDGAGAFYIYRSLFERSSVADVHIKNNGWFSMHQNVSVGSRRFFQGDVLGYNSAPIIVKGNRIVDTVDPAAISNSNMGPLMLIDNQIRSAAGNTGAAVVVSNFVSGRDVVSIGNSYTVPNPIQTVDSTDRRLSINDTIVARTTISGSLPTLPPTPSRQSRQVFEVAAGAGSAQIQAAINAAASSGATNPIVHLPPGRYDLSTSLVVPPKTRLQIAGDALTTVLNWIGPANGTMIQLQGPSYATVRDVQMLGFASPATAIGITSANQSGGRVFIEGSSPGALSATGLSQTQLSLQANPAIYSLSLSAVQSAVVVGTGVLGPVSSTGSSSALIADTWYEGPLSNLYRMDSGVFTHMGGHMTPASEPNTPAILLDGFKGRATFVGTQFDLSSVPNGVGIRIGAENNQTNALFLGMTSNKAGYFSRSSTGGSVGLVTSKTIDAQGRATNWADQGEDSAAFVTKMLGQARSLLWDTTPYSAPAGSTDVRIYRVKATQTKGIQVIGN